jgi:hypothetical protein
MATITNSGPLLVTTKYKIWIGNTMKTTEFLKENSIIAQEADDMHKDHEVQMARSQMYSAAQSAIEIHRLLKDISELEGLDGWVASKLTLASEYLETVRDYLKYEAVSAEPEMMEFAYESADYALEKIITEGEGDVSPPSDAYLNSQSFKQQQERDVQRIAEPKKISSSSTGGTIYQTDKGTIHKAGHTGLDSGAGRGALEPKYHSDAGRTARAPDYDQKSLTPDRPKFLGGNAARLPQAGTGGGPRGGGSIGGGGGMTDPFGSKKRSLYFEKKESVKENASAGASSSSGMATSMIGPAHKPTSGVPKKLGNAHKPKKVTLGKGVY